jgi:hypothetical protein
MATQDIFLKKLRDVLGRTSGSITDLEYQFYLEQLGKDRGCISDLILEYLKQKTGSSFKTVADIEREWFYEGNTFDELYDGLVQFLYKYRASGVYESSGTTYISNVGSGDDAKVVSPEPIVLDFLAEGATLVEVNAEASIFDWNLVDNLGSIEASYAGTETFLVTEDGYGVATQDNNHITIGGA